MLKLFPPLLASILFALICTAPAMAKEYSLTIAREPVSISGTPLSKITVNGSIPGPTLEFTEGEEATIHVTNHMDETTSVHWHGMLVPAEMDGVPGFNGFAGIRPHETFTYHFPIRQSGTYWYHAHSNAQEQDGHYGAIIIHPKQEAIKAGREYVMLFSDYSEESPKDILGNLKSDAGYYNHAKRTVSDFIADTKEKGFWATLQDRKDWGNMRMDPTDLADVTGYTFLVNGKTPAQNWTATFKPGETIRLRMINASAMSIYDVQIPGLKMKVVAADGQNVEPIAIDEFRFGNAETYDVLVQPTEDKAYSIVAEPIDRTGFAIATLAPHEGMQGEPPPHRPRALLTMADMNMDAAMAAGGMEMHMAHESATSGWADAATPKGDKALTYADLKFLGTQDITPPSRTIRIALGGSMDRYLWTLNGKKFEEAEPIALRYGERVRLTFSNETMMAHPIHLHGMFVQLENGQPANKLPNKHTVIIPPGQSMSVLLTANEAGQWALHCHLLYHMLSGMMSSIVVTKEGGLHHAH